jgi:hypothetical protein
MYTVSYTYQLELKIINDWTRHLYIAIQVGSCVVELPLKPSFTSIVFKKDNIGMLPYFY